MIKKLAVIVFFLGVVALLSAPVFAEESTTAKPADASAQKTEVVPTDETMLVDEEMLPAEEGVGEGVVTGEITSLDAAKGAISVKGADGAEKEFNVVDGETILWKGIEDIKLSDVKKGDKAEVGYYTDDAGKLIASWVDVIVPEQPAAAIDSQVVPAPAVTGGQ
ncbi:MAG: hypothetical protein Q8N76_00490 [Candidatus Omnitrophota bacterium]|nr:hypothetical protein [Candidatus Omnitrophota bacterium]